MSENKSVWDQELFKSKKSKITVLVLIGLTLLTLAILVWLNSTGQINIGADTVTPAKCVKGYPNGASICIISTLKSADQSRVDKVSYNSGGIIGMNEFHTLEYKNNGKWTIASTKDYDYSTQTHSGYFNINFSPSAVRKYRVMFYNKFVPNYSQIKSGAISPCQADTCNESYGQLIGIIDSENIGGGGTTPTPAPTTPSGDCQTSSTDPGVCINAFSLAINTSCTTSTNHLTWNLGSNPSSKYSQITVQRRDETTGGSFTLGDPQINQSAITSSWPCNSSGQCSHTDKVSNSTHKYTYRVYVKNKVDGKWYRSNEAYSIACGSTPTASPSPSPTSTYTLYLNDINGSKCVDGTNQQINYIGWNGTERQVELFVRQGTGSYSSLGVQTGGFYPHQYQSLNEVYYQGISKTNPPSTSVIGPMKNLNCQSSIPTPTPTPTVSPTVSPTASPTPSPVTPDAPVLTATPQSSTEIKLTWTATLNPGEGYYKIYNAKTGELIVQVESSFTEWPFNGLNCETEYSYYITAGIDTLESSPSNTASATTGGCSSGQDISDKKPENIQLVYIGNGLATLSWDAVDGATGYDIYDCNGTYITSTADTSHNFTGLSCGRDLCYYVIAHNAAGEKSKQSDNATASTEACASGNKDVGSLVSTGGALWFNISLALVLTAALGYLFFRREIWEKK